jgi:pSer/pThr/pTyr-binding forkhead associated (FHA) protein
MPPSAQPTVTVTQPGGQVQVISLPAELNVATIGRLADNLVALPWDLNVSRHHAQLQRLGTEWTIVDDGLSRNGTTVNGSPLAGYRRLRDGDVIQVGVTVLTFRHAPPDEFSTIGPGGPRLSDPERLVLAALCRPYREHQQDARPPTTDQIAKEVYLSAPTVKGHLNVLFRKFQIDANLARGEKRAQLAAEAIRRHAV